MIIRKIRKWDVIYNTIKSKSMMSPKSIVNRILIEDCNKLLLWESEVRIQILVSKLDQVVCPGIITHQSQLISFRITIQIESFFFTWDLNYIVINYVRNHKMRKQWRSQNTTLGNFARKDFVFVHLLSLIVEKNV